LSIIERYEQILISFQSFGFIYFYVFEFTDSIPIIGCGGIFSGADAYEKICAGASAVQIYTVLMFKGLGCVSKIKKDLSEILTYAGIQYFSVFLL